MSIFQEAFDDAGSTSSSGPIPDGEYDVKLLDVSDTDHPVTGVTSTNLEYEVTMGEHQNRKVWDNVQHRDETMWKVAKIWNSMGMKEQPSDWKEFHLKISQNCTGKHFSITVRNREYNGKNYTNVISIKVNNEKAPF